LGTPPSGSWSLESTTRYIYDGKRVIAERDGFNQPLVAYTRGTDLSGVWRAGSAGAEALERAGGVGGLLARSDGYSAGNWTTHNFYHADGNGNVTYLVDSGQGLAASYRYDAFGNTLASSGSLADLNVYRFSSRECHVNSGMYYYLYRFYDPSLQRWLNRDPIQEQTGVFTRKQLRRQARSGWNLYAICHNDTLDFVDTDGRNWFTHLISTIITYIGMGGRCCNMGSKSTIYVDDGTWHPLPAGMCTGTFTDCDGMMCGGKFYKVHNPNSISCTPDSKCEGTPTSDTQFQDDPFSPISRRDPAPIGPLALPNPTAPNPLPRYYHQ
jgi:RHS repeat-associated protein